MNKHRWLILGLVVALLVLGSTLSSYARTTSLSPLPKMQFLDENGKPYSGGLLYTCYPGTVCGPTTTTDLKSTYTDYTGTVPNTNPVVMDSAGRANIWLSGYYKMALHTSAGVLVWTVDNVSSGGGLEGTDICKYTDLATAITEIGATVTTLVVTPNCMPLNVSSAADVTVPSNITLKWETCGGVLTRTGSGTGNLRIKGAISNPLMCQIFDDNTAYTVRNWVKFGDDDAGAPMIEAIYPQWWGAKMDCSDLMCTTATDDRRYLQSALYSSPKPGIKIAITGAMKIGTPLWYPASGGYTYPINLEGIPAYPSYANTIGVTARPSRLVFTGTGSLIEGKGPTGADNNIFQGTIRNLSMFSTPDTTDIVTPDGSFGGASTWVLGAGWAIAGGVATHTAGSTAEMTGATTSTSAHYYKYTIEVSGRTAGSVQICLGNDGNRCATISSNGTSSGNISSNGTNASIRFIPTTDFDGSLDNLDLVKVWRTGTRGIRVYGAHTARFENISTYGFEYGWYSSDWRGVYYSIFDGCSFGFSYMAFYQNSYINGTKFHRNRFHSSVYGFYGYYSGVAANFDGNWFEGNTFAPFLMSACTQVTEVGSYYENNDYTVSYQSSFSGNAFYSCAVNQQGVIYSLNNGDSYSVNLDKVASYNSTGVYYGSYYYVNQSVSYVIYTDGLARGTITGAIVPRDNVGILFNEGHDNDLVLSNPKNPHITTKRGWPTYSALNREGDITFNQRADQFGGITAWVTTEPGASQYADSMNTRLGEDLLGTSTDNSTVLSIRTLVNLNPYAYVWQGVAIQVDNGGSPLTFSWPVGDSTTQWDISIPVGTTCRYTYDGTGTALSAWLGTRRVGETIYVQAQNFNAANKGTFQITGLGADYFEVTNAGCVAETNKTNGTGYVRVHAGDYAISNYIAWNSSTSLWEAHLDRVANAAVVDGVVTYNQMAVKQIRATRLDHSNLLNTVTGTVGRTVLRSYTLPPSFMEQADCLDFFGEGGKTSAGAGDVKVIELRFGSTYTVLANANDTNHWRVEGKICNAGNSYTNQKVSYTFYDAGTPTGYYTTMTEDSRLTPTVGLYATVPGAGDTVTIDLWRLDPR